MSPAEPGLYLLRSPWIATFQKLLSLVDEHLIIACPFVKRFATERILAQLEKRNVRGSVRLRLITDLRPECALAGSMDLGAISELGRKVPGFELTHLPSVHAKVYVADGRMAIVTSGNLTQSGLLGNVEYGIALVNEAMVSEIRGPTNFARSQPDRGARQVSLPAVCCSPATFLSFPHLIIRNCTFD